MTVANTLTDYSYRPLPRHAPHIQVHADRHGVVTIDAPSQHRVVGESICDLLYQRVSGTVSSTKAIPNRVFLAQRKPTQNGVLGDWNTLTFEEVLGRAQNIGQWLLNHDFNANTPLMLLSGNSIAHACMTFGAMLVGVPVVPVSPSYSLLSQDFDKLGYVYDQIKPKLIFTEATEPFARALTHLNDHHGANGLSVISCMGHEKSDYGVDYLTLIATEATPAVRAAHELVTGQQTAKILFTSGSTGMPKGVINTHLNLLHAAVRRTELPATDPIEEAEVMLDWLPWHHTFGGNAVLNGALATGSSLYIDDGRPIGDLFNTTISNIIDVQPTQFSSVPAAYGLLADALESNEALAHAMFEKVKQCNYGGAVLGQPIHDRIQQVAIKTCGQRIHFVSGYGSTETTSLTTSVYWTMETMGQIGLPLPGTQIKLHPVGSAVSSERQKYNIWVKGEQIMEGYLHQPEASAQVMDQQGFYNTGDSVTWVDPKDYLKGLAFAGRVSENFKLSSGTFVQTGTVKQRLLSSLAPLVLEAVLAGEGENNIAALAWLNLPACAKACGLSSEASPKEIFSHPDLRPLLREKLATYNVQHRGNASQVQRLGLLTTPPTIDNSEMTDKRYINQAAVLKNRAKEVAQLFELTAPPGFIEA